MKKSFFTLFTSLVIWGLLMVWSTNAFKYTATWPSKIAFTKGTLNLIDSIKYGSWEENSMTTLTLDNSCELKDYGHECTIPRESADTYDIIIKYKTNTYEWINNVRMNNEINNIKKIENFDGINIKNIVTLDLSNNSGIDLNNQSSSKIENIYVNNSNLNEFKLNLDNQHFKNIYFNDNKLSSLSGEIRCNRDNYLIHLDNDILIGNGGYNNNYNIRLERNPINFVWLTKYYYTDQECVKNYGWNGYNCSKERDIKCENNDIIFKNETWYSFERFGYQEQDWTNLSYIYTLSWSSNDFNTGWIAYGTWITIPAKDLPFSSNATYTFKVCIQEGTDCDSIDFQVINDNLKLEFIENKTNIESWWTANSLTGVTFARIHTGIDDNVYKYPEEQIYGYEYRLYKNNNYQPIVKPTTLEKTCDGENCHWTKNIWQALTDEWIFDTYKDLTWDFKFEVYILDNDNHSYIYWDDNEPIRTTRYFHIIEPEQPDNPTIQITRPSDPETEAITYFSWTPSIDHDYFDFNNYYWSISWVDNSTLLTGLIWDINNTWFSTGNLNNGSYTFNVMLNYTKKSSLETGVAIDDTYSANGGAKPFTINKPSSLKIISPATWAVLTQAENVFSRTWTTSNTFIKYIYSVIWNKYSYTWETEDQDYTWFSIRNLEDWAYTFTVIMHTDAGTKTDSRNFSVNATSWAYINITSPGNWKTYTWNRIKLVPTDFTWVWTWSTRISKFTYKLTNTTTNSEISSWTINKNSNWNYSIQQISLPSGKYSFEVKMLDSNGTTIKDKTHNFTISIPSHLTISTPPAWQLNSKNVTFSRTWFAEFGNHYKYKLDRVNDQWNIISTITWNENTSITSFSMTNIHNGKYTFTVSIMNSSNSEIKTESRTFWIPDDQDLILDISDWTTSTKNIKTGTWIFSRWWKSEDFYWYYYSISGTNFKNEPFIHTWKTSWEVTWNIILTNLTSWKYRFSVNMLDENDSIITWKYLDFTVDIPASLKITNPSNWSTITSSSTTLSRMGKWDIFRTWYSTDSRHYEYELLQVTTSWQEQKASSPKTNANSFSYSSFQDGASYQLKVKLYSGNTLIASDTSSFSVSIPKHSSGWWGWSSSKSHPTNDLSVSVTNDEPTTNERIEVVVDISDKYTWKVDFTKMQYYSFDEEKRIDIPVTSKNYVTDYSDDAKLGYVKFDSSDDGEKNLSEFLMFSQPGNYRIHVEDKDWYKEYTEFYVWKWNKAQVTKASDDEYYIARSCKKYKIEYLNNLGVYTSPNLKQDEYFVSKDYFKRYIDSKNRRADWCPTNIWWITTTYRDTSNSSDRYTAPNGKVYFINWKNWSYSSTELDKELNGSKKFWSVTDLKYFIRDRNPFISMAKLWPTK